MYKQIFEKKNGNPILLEERFDEISMVAIFDYDKEIYTDKKPSSDLYQPIQFDNDLNDWVGSSFDEWIETNKPRTPYNPEKVELQLAQTQMQLAKTAMQLQKSQKEIASIVIELSKKDERIKILEQQQANTLLEIAKLKGEN